MLIHSCTRVYMYAGLHSALGFSDKNVAQFVLSAAKSAKSSAALLKSLSSGLGVPVSAETQRFAARACPLPTH